MSHDLDLLIASELRQLDNLIGPRRELIARSLRGSPTMEELDALSALLHSAYTSIERILTHIAKNEGIDEDLRSKSFMWHTALLNALANPIGGCPAVISMELHADLKQYLSFRHLFRHAYLHELQWSKMRTLVENLENVVLSFMVDINNYLSRHI